MIVVAPKILYDSWMLIGRQEWTSHGGIVDLLVIAPDGALVLDQPPSSGPGKMLVQHCS